MTRSWKTEEGKATDWKFIQRQTGNTKKSNRKYRKTSRKYVKDIRKP